MLLGCSEKAGQATASWRSLPDGDMHLDTFALMYEAHSRGARSPWKNYFCTFPKEYDLPLLYKCVHTCVCVCARARSGMGSLEGFDAMML